MLLFGSYAYGTPNPDSDIDVLVVTKDDFIPKSDVGKPMYLEIRIRKGQNIIPMSLMGENDSRVDIMYGEYEILLNRNREYISVTRR